MRFLADTSQEKKKIENRNVKVRGMKSGSPAVLDCH